MLVLVSIILGFAMFGVLRGLDLVWLHLMPLFGCGMRLWMPGRSMRTISLLAMPTMLIYFMLFHILFASFSSIACLLVFRLCLCM